MGDILHPLFGENGMVAVISVVVIVALIVAAYWFIRRPTRIVAGAVRGRPPRLSVVESLAVDNRRQLVLVRRDGVEHLLLVGGPSDLVVEPTILRARQRPAARPAAPDGPVANAPQPAPPPRPVRPAERAAARLRAIKTQRPPLSEDDLVSRLPTKTTGAGQEARPQRPAPAAERAQPAPPESPPAPPVPLAPEKPAPAAPEPDTLQAALAAADLPEPPESDLRVSIVEAAPPEERYGDTEPSPFAPGAPVAPDQPTTPSPFAPNRESLEPRPPVEQTRPSSEEPARPAPGALPQTGSESASPVKALEKDMARLLGQMSGDERPEGT